MTAPTKITSGIDQFDRLIDGLYIGDNVVWHDDSGSLAAQFCTQFINSSHEAKQPLVYVSFDRSPKNLLDKLGSLADGTDLTLLDCFTYGKGKGAPVFLKFFESGRDQAACRIQTVKNPSDPASIMETIEAVHASLKGDVRFVFESLTGMQELWGGEEHIATFYAHTCPRLYELNTVAYWIMEKEAHSARLRAQINQIAQVAIELSVKRGSTSLKVIKAEKRDPKILNRSFFYWSEGAGLVFDMDNRSRTRINLGGRLRTLRLQNGFSQKELARLVGVTPSSISQVEGNLAYPSLTALIKMAEVLGVSVGSLFRDKTVETQQVVFSGADARKYKHPLITQHGVSISRLLASDFTANAEPHIVEIPPATTLDTHFFLFKGEEVGYLLQGRLQLNMGRERYEAQAGDIIYLKSEIPEQWHNSGPESARLLWFTITSF